VWRLLFCEPTREILFENKTSKPFCVMRIFETILFPLQFSLGVVLMLASPWADAGQQLGMPNIFGDQMVLQRNQPVRIWGWAGAGNSVTVSFAGNSHTVISDSEGKWEVALATMPAQSTGQTLTVKSADEILLFEDVLVGDVWLCGGQSNMEWRLRSSRDADLEIPSSSAPGLRYLRIQPGGSPRPKGNFPREKGDGVWLPCNPETAGDCSAVAYFFGRRLHRHLDVPIGLINAAWGGTMAQHWVSRKTLETLPAVRSSLDAYDEKCRKWVAEGGEQGALERFDLAQKQWEALAEKARDRGEKDPPNRPNRRNYQNPAEGRIPAGPLNSMIMPIAGLSLRGVLFYQGENNSFGDAWIPFRETFPAVISDWRRIFRNDELPFGIVQIAGWSTRRSMTYDMNHHTNIVREVQFNTWRTTPNTGLIVSFDANSNSSIHPGRKSPVGDRSARWALSEVYGAMDATRGKSLQWRGPVYQSMEKEKDRIRITFEEGSDQGLRLERADARGFYIAGEDRIFHHADARVLGGRDVPAMVEVWSDDVPSPVAVRYAWSNLPLGSLMNGKELPAYPFRTDKWPLKPHYGEALYEVSP